jgi:L-aspartate oxidase
VIFGNGDGVNNLDTDFLIIGSGIAALRAALELTNVGTVLILTKASSMEGSTIYAQGGIAAAMGEGDSAEIHAADTLAAGDGLCREQAVHLLTHQGPSYVQELINWGARFDRNEDGGLSLAQEGAHAIRRVLHARDATGREICRVLWQEVSRHERISVIEHALVLDVIVDDGRCVAARFADEKGRVLTASASATLLATGGAGQLYRDTTNPPVATGDGVAIAYRAGARVIDLEFIQFHPTAMSLAGHPRFLLSEALRGEGAKLINESGDAFMSGIDPAGDLAPRDRVARAITKEVERTGGQVYLTLDALPQEFVRKRFPLIAEACQSVGLDLARDRIPVGPAAHYVMGGVETDLDGQTSLDGLFAAGEVACTGVHGANRLASNSLLEGLVFGASAGRAMAHATMVPLGRSTLRHLEDTAQQVTGQAELPTVEDVQDLMWRYVSLFRDRDGLSKAVSVLDRWAEVLPKNFCDEGTSRIISLITTGRLVANAALRRQESRGAHYRSDFPKRDDIDWSRHIGESKDDDLNGSRG